MSAQTTATTPIPVTVLIVDDEAPVLHLLDRILQSAGYVTRLASSGVDALAVAEGEGTIDILLTDLMMPEMNGDEVARRMRLRRPALKVLYYTGFCDRLFEEKPTLWEDEAFLEKPCGPTAVLQAVALLRNQNRCMGPLKIGAPATLPFVGAT